MNDRLYGGRRKYHFELVREATGGSGLPLRWDRGWTELAEHRFPSAGAGDADNKKGSAPAYGKTARGLKPHLYYLESFMARLNSLVKMVGYWAGIEDASPRA